MSLHNVRIPTREEILAATSRPLPRSIYFISAALAVIGTLVFLFGAFTGQDRVWHALLSNWLYFTTISSAGVVFVAVQRITTARSCWQITRFLDGYATFLAVAFILLVLILLPVHQHICPLRHEARPVPEERLWFHPTCFVLRYLVAFGLIPVLSVRNLHA